jgi:hypothetical protein
MSSNVPVAFNLTQPAQPNTVYSYYNTELNCSIGWSPHLDLILGIYERLTEAVGRLPRRYLMPPVEGEVFKTL